AGWSRQDQREVSRCLVRDEKGAETYVVDWRGRIGGRRRWSLHLVGQQRIRRQRCLRRRTKKNEEGVSWRAGGGVRGVARTRAAMKCSRDWSSRYLLPSNTDSRLVDK